MLHNYPEKSLLLPVMKKKERIDRQTDRKTHCSATQANDPARQAGKREGERGRRSKTLLAIKP